MLLPILGAGIVGIVIGIILSMLALSWVYSEPKVVKKKANEPTIEEFENAMYWGKV